MLPLVEDMSEIYAHPLPRVYDIFLFAIEYSAKAQPPQHKTTGAPQENSIYSWQRMGICLTCLQLVGTWVKNMFRNLVPYFWRVMLFLACHVLNVACHGVSISIVSMSSVSCRVRLLRVSVSMPCRGHPAIHSWFEAFFPT